MNWKRYRTLLALIALMSLVLAACGNGAEDDTTAEDPEAADAPGEDADADADEVAEPEEPADAAEEILLGAVWPQSGPFEFQGAASLAGFQAAVDDVNADGGIAALGGAQLAVASVDAGSTPEEAASAAERLLREEPVGVAGSWLSSLTLASSEVTERAGIPLVTEAFADEATERGFEYIFSYVPKSTQQDDLILEGVIPSLAAEDIDLERVVLVGDNSAAATPLQDALAEQFDDRGIEIALQEQWTPPLDDPSGISRQIAGADADAVFMIAFSFPDVSRLTADLRGRGVTAPVIQSGGQALLPAWRDFGDEVAGLTTFVGTHPLVQSEDISADLAEAAGEPYVWQDHLHGYFAGRLLAEAIEQAGSAEPDAIRDALAAMELTEGPVADLLPVETVAFDDDGRIVPGHGVLAQWQEVDGELTPCTVWPEQFAPCDPNWTP